MQMDAMADRLASIHKKKEGGKGNSKDSKGNKGKGKQAGKGSYKGRSSSQQSNGDTTETDSETSRAKGKGKGAGKGKTSRNICYDWKNYGECWRDNCTYQHGGSDMVMVMERLDELSDKFEARMNQAGHGQSRIQGGDPKQTLNGPKQTLKTHTVLT